MKSEKKGVVTRKTIVDNARIAFNEKGIALTFETLSKLLSIPKGRITNHFPTKESLFLAIMADYEEQMQSTIAGMYTQYQSALLKDYLQVIAAIMDIQYQYRCGIIYLNVLSPSQHEQSVHIKKTFERNKISIKNRLESMVKSGILKKDILTDAHFNSFIFVYVNMMTQWVIYYDMYDNEKKYKDVKATYLQSLLLYCYHPHFTDKGLEEYDKLSFNHL
ncbi:MAG: hypothetical protein RL172_1467 [Bacteroidota bacterium]|jgi:AcrR family transcriptional regulator